MLDGISSILTALKDSSPQLLTGIAVACAILLFSPPVALSTFGLKEFVTNFRPFIGVGFIGATSILLVQLVWWGRKFVLSPFHRKAMEKARLDLLENLTASEKAYLLPFIANGENTQYFSIQDGVAQGLNTKGIIYRAASVGDMLDGFAYNLQPWARKMLSFNPSYLEGAGSPPKTPRERMGLW